MRKKIGRSRFVLKRIHERSHVTFQPLSRGGVNEIMNTGKRCRVHTRVFALPTDRHTADSTRLIQFKERHAFGTEEGAGKDWSGGWL